VRERRENGPAWCVGDCRRRRRRSGACGKEIPKEILLFRDLRSPDLEIGTSGLTEVDARDKSPSFVCLPTLGHLADRQSFSDPGDVDTTSLSLSPEVVFYRGRNAVLPQSAKCQKEARVGDTTLCSYSFLILGYSRDGVLVVAVRPRVCFPWHWRGVTTTMN